MSGRRLLLLGLLSLAVACGHSSSSSGDMGGGGGGGGGAGGGGGGAGGDMAMGPAPYDWLQFGYDAQHSGNNPMESTITTANVATLALKQQVAFPAPVDGAPVYLSGVTTANGTQDLVFVETTMADLYALDAQTLQTVWMKSHPHAGTCTSSNGGPCYTTSEPAIDPNRMFVYAYGLDGLVHKHAVGDGSEVTSGGWPEVASLKPNLEKGSSNLAVAVAKNGTFLYAAAAGYPGDAGDYQGHVTTINLGDGSQKVMNVLCSNQPPHFTTGGTPDCTKQGNGVTQAAVWGRGGVLYFPGNDRIYFASGNGDYDAANGDWGDSVLAANADGSGIATGPLDVWTPSDEAALNSADADVGSTGPALVPVPAGSKYPHIALQGNKVPQGSNAGPIRLIDLDDLSGMGGPGHLGGELFKMDVPQGNEILTQPAVWVNPADQTTWIFIADDSGISGIKLVPDGGTAMPSLMTGWMKGTGGTSPVVANGILYYAGNGAGRGGNNTVYALDPTTGNVLWMAQVKPMTGTTAVGGIHWESVIVAHGALYISSEHGNSGGGVGDGTGTLSRFAPQ